MKEGVVCDGCGARYENKRWYAGESVPTIGRGEGVERIACPACRRMRENNPAGIVTFSGSYLTEHEEEILNTIKNSEERGRSKNPMARIMAINQEGDQLIVRTTDDKLAQRLGREVFHAFQGNLEYHWSHDQKFVRVNWQR
jgi:NMD protein affecting ribosome stability and mRNA decay